MNKIIMILIFFAILDTQKSYTQDLNNKIEITYNELLQCKVDSNKYDFGWLTTVWSGIPCYRDYTQTFITSQLVDKKNDSIIYTSTEQENQSLRIIPTIIMIDKVKKEITIEGVITGAWDHIIPSEFEIYIGHRVDTVSYLELSPNFHGDMYYNGIKVESTIIIDTVPAFYLKNTTKFEAYRGEKYIDNTNYKEMNFKILAYFDEKSILVFGVLSRYAEIFEIGKLLLK